MNIREWYGYSGNYNRNLDINLCVDGLLQLYAKAIMTYFSVNDAKSYHEIQNVDSSSLNNGQKLFLKWLNEKGFPYLEKLASTNLPNNDELIAHLEYDKYILEEEMDFQYPDDVRSSLIGIVNDVPGYIEAANEVSAAVTEWDEWETITVEQPSVFEDLVAKHFAFWDKWQDDIASPIISASAKDFVDIIFGKKVFSVKTSVTTSYKMEDSDNPVSNYKESAVIADSLFLSRGQCNGNCRKYIGLL
ncbi:hypothetical protein HPT25_14385 [Bacillus sp. BRMEA1]|uniref:hypothetical protein n=1 Tax=Neobacillus endophyticus TaxID=2738405 RepID=UPI0015632E5F|nr:hypothetical protein [Neobacillus endophyticus]NRD78548.1 hypothetical protein [Neobacillus endophyticus]